jgi:soluble lytic murein transglycosylase-like protein
VAGAATPAPAQDALPPTVVAACEGATLPATVTIDTTEYDCAVVNAKPADPPAAEPADAASTHDAKPGAGAAARLGGRAEKRAEAVTAKPHATSADQVPAGAAGAITKAAVKTTAAPDRGPRAKAKATASTTGAALTYASLPASWLSLAPLSLPAFSIEGFSIPPALLPIYQAAAAQYAVPWEVLAAINEIETNFGRNAGISSAGAMGWMQFIYSSWERWGIDADGDRRRDPRNPVDAIFAAARYLHDAGAGSDLPKAIFAYNHADWYVNQVVERAREFAGLDRTLVAALTRRALLEDSKLYRAPGNPFAGHGAIEPRAGQVLLFTKRQLTRAVLHSDDITIYQGGRQDIAAGHVDRRVLATLVYLARLDLKPTVTSLTSGHSLRTTSGSISPHSYGHAVDISAINGVPIAGHQGAGSITARTLARLVQLQGYGRPDQIISLMTIDGQDNTLSMGDHDDHIHVGFARVARVPDAGRPADIRQLVAALRARTPRP